MKLLTISQLSAYALLALFMAATARADIFSDADKAVHKATGLPTPGNPKLELPDPIGAATANADLAADIAATTGCASCAKDIRDIGASGQDLVLKAIGKYGYVIAPPGDLGGRLVLHILTKNHEEHQVEIPTVNPPPPTPSTASWDIVADCLIQRDAGRIDAYSMVEFANVANIKDGDILRATAPKVCPEFNIGSAKSITSAEMLMAGASVDPRGKEGDLRYLIIGKAK